MTTYTPPPWAHAVDEALAFQGRSRLWLADAIGYSRGHMTHLFTGSRIPQAATFPAIAKALGIPPAWFPTHD